MDFKDFGVSELGVLIGILIVGALAFFNKATGSEAIAGISGMVGLLITMRKINKGQQIKYGNGNSTIETVGGSEKPVSPPSA